jgi:pyruvate formate lyase activating enzyme
MSGSLSLPPPQTLRTARRIAMNAGLRYVYTGNIHDPAGQATYCHACGDVLVGRDWYDITAWRLSADGRCTNCDTRCRGVFEVIAG